MKRFVEKNGKIYARVTYRDSKGKRRQLWRKAHSRTDAKALAKELEAQLKLGTEPFEHTGTLEEFLDKWLESQKQTVSERTYEDYKGIARLHVRPALGKLRLTEIRPLNVQGMVDGLKAKGLSPRSIRHAHGVLSQSLKQAVKWKILLVNPAQFVDLPKQVRREMKCFTIPQAKTFLKACDKNRFGLIFELALVSGMRPEEYLGLRWGDVDFQKSTVTVQRVIVWKRWVKGWYFAEPKTPKSRRTIPLPAYLMKKLRAHRKAQMSRGEQSEHNLVFTSENGTPVSLRNLQRRHFKPLLVNAGLPDIRLYDARHTCATLLLAAGVNPKVVAERLGHSSVVLTLDTYSHCLPTMQQAATETLGVILGRGGNSKKDT